VFADSHVQDHFQPAASAGMRGTMSYFVRACHPVDPTIDCRILKYDRST
jgi:hypothetical protein